MKKTFLLSTAAIMLVVSSVFATKAILGLRIATVYYQPASGTCTALNSQTITSSNGSAFSTLGTNAATIKNDNNVNIPLYANSNCTTPVYFSL
jgi:hypothetical protein